ncbi:MAG: hypothetical protein ACXVPK_13255 [Tumebacillaceae bacterium]
MAKVCGKANMKGNDRAQDMSDVQRMIKREAYVMYDLYLNR